MRGKLENQDLHDSARRSIYQPKIENHLNPCDINVFVRDGDTLSGAWVSNRVKVEEESNLKIKSKQMFEAAKAT